MDNRKSNLRIVTRSVNGKNVSNAIKQQRKEQIKKATSASALKPRTEKQIQISKTNAVVMNKSGKNRHIGDKNYASKPVINIITQMIYVNVREAAEKEGYNYRTLKCKLNGWSKNNTNLIHLDKYHPTIQDEDTVRQKE